MRCAVLGSPIGHSLSPVLHAAAYAELGLDWTYGRHEVTEATLPAFLDGLDEDWRGLSLTMPLKRAVLPLLDEVSEQARRAGAVNTVLLGGGDRAGGRGRGRRGDNTDVPGTAAALRERWSGPVDRAVVVGGGATAASVGLALADLGCRDLTLLVRDPERAARTAAVLGGHPGKPGVRVATSVPEGADVLVSTVPAGAAGHLAGGLVATVGVVFDVVYDPWPTPLGRAAVEAGAVAVSGLDLLVHQAALQVRLMTGHEAPLAAMRAAGEQRLRER